MLPKLNSEELNRMWEVITREEYELYLKDPIKFVDQMLGDLTDGYEKDQLLSIKSNFINELNLKKLAALKEGPSFSTRCKRNIHGFFDSVKNIFLTPCIKLVSMVAKFRDEVVSRWDIYWFWSSITMVSISVICYSIFGIGTDSILGCLVGQFLPFFSVVFVIISLSGGAQKKQPNLIAKTIVIFSILVQVFTTFGASINFSNHVLVSEFNGETKIINGRESFLIPNYLVFGKLTVYPSKFELAEYKYGLDDNKVFVLMGDCYVDTSNVLKMHNGGMSLDHYFNDLQNIKMAQAASRLAMNYQVTGQISEEVYLDEIKSLKNDLYYLKNIRYEIIDEVK